ncbi:MAG: M48 family metalloprotease [Terracidiphilus sp.]
MKRLQALVAVLAIAGGSLYLTQRRKSQDEVSANAALDAAADLQRDLTRMPMQLTRLPDKEETRIGDELAARYVSFDPPQTSAAQELERYVSQVGERVAAHTRRRLNYRFHLIADPDFINAFALPGGHVFIGMGLIGQMTSEDELAFVLGHELEHIDHYHAAERVQIEARLRNLNLDVVAAIAQIPMSLWQAGYSKEQEFEADREGLRLSVVAGYSPQGAVKMLARLADLHREYVVHAGTPVGELSQVAIEGLTGYFRSHPLPSERIAQANEVIAQDHLNADEPLRPFKIPDA